MEQIQITARNLARLALRSLCRRCAYLSLHTRHKMPFQMFPSVFASIDAYSKGLLAAHQRTYGVVPPWLDGFDDLVEPIPVPHFSRFNVADEATGVVLTGTPDVMFRRRDHSVAIFDFNCGRSSRFGGAYV